MNRPCWLITGASGQLGGHLLAAVTARLPDQRVVATSRRSVSLPDGTLTVPVDLADGAALRKLLDEHHPSHVIHLAAVTFVAEAQQDTARSRRVNVEATQEIGEWAEAHRARTLLVSTDMVFDGNDAPYAEDDDPQPLSHYGNTKVAAELAVRERPAALVVRLPLMYGFPAIERETTFVSQVNALRCGAPLRLFTDEFRTPLALIDAARALVALAASDMVGIMHVAGPERLSRYDMGVRFASALGIRRPNLIAASRLSVEGGESRAADLSLVGERFGALFPDLVPRPICPASLGNSNVKSERHAR